MYLDKVKDLKKIKLGSNQVLVEIIEKKSKLVLASSDGTPSTAIEREEIFLSNVVDIKEGDLILEAKYDISGDIGFHLVEGRKFVVLNAHSIKMWTPSNNFKLDV